MKPNRDDIQSGDLLIWAGNNGGNKSSFYLKLVRLLTMSDYGHVSVAWRTPEGLFHVEATQPCIRESVITPEDDFYCIHMGLKLQEQALARFFDDKIGLKYSIQDAICAYFGLTLKDDRRYQCVELANLFYRSVGINFGKVYVPGKFIRKIMALTGKSLVKYNSIDTEDDDE